MFHIQGVPRGRGQFHYVFFLTKICFFLNLIVLLCQKYNAIIIIISSRLRSILSTYEEFSVCREITYHG